MNLPSSIIIRALRNLPALESILNSNLKSTGKDLIKNKENNICHYDHPFQASSPWWYVLWKYKGLSYSSQQSEAEPSFLWMMENSWCLLRPLRSFRYLPRIEPAQQAPLSVSYKLTQPFENISWFKKKTLKTYGITYLGDSSVALKCHVDKFNDRKFIRIALLSYFCKAITDYYQRQQNYDTL